MASVKAKIVDIEDGKVTVKTENGKFLTISEKKLKFSHRLNQKIIIERNNNKYYILPDNASFWGDDEPKIKKKAKSKKQPRYKKPQIILVVILVLIILTGIPLLILHNNSVKEEERSSNLEKCLDNAVSEYLKDTYAKNIKCYEQYGGEDAEEKINENKTHLEYAQIQECVYDARENYKVTDEERNNAGSDLAANIMLVKRVGEGFKAEKECYTKYGKLGDYRSEIDKIEADIKENQSMLEYGESEQESIRNYSNNHRSLNCTTNTVGSSAYTNCY